MTSPAEAVVVPCPGCRARLRLAAAVIGRNVRCPKCRHEWTAVAPAAGPEGVSTGPGGATGSVGSTGASGTVEGSVEGTSDPSFPTPAGRSTNASGSAAGLNPPSHPSRPPAAEAPAAPSEPADGAPAVEDAASPGSSRSAGGASGGTLPAGTRVAEFEIIRVLGRGGMGTVYEAMDHQLERPVALKVLAGELIAAGQEHVDRFLREAKTAAKLEHGNVVNVYQVGRRGEIVYIAMQLVRGASAAEMLRKLGRLPVAEAVRVTLEAAAGLAAAHRMGLIHRDVKPANIMIGDNGTVKVADFGLAKAAGGSGVTLSASGSVVGTPQYMCPEQCQGRPMDHRGDIYSLGITFYTLLAGQPPFTGDNAPAILYKHVYETLPDIRAVRPEVPDAVAAVLARATAKQAEDRYPTTDELVADLAAISAGLADPSRMPATTIAPRAVGATRPLPRLATTGAAGVTAVEQAVGTGTVPRTAGGRGLGGATLWVGAVAAVGIAGTLVIRALVDVGSGEGGRDASAHQTDKDKTAAVVPVPVDKGKVDTGSGAADNGPPVRPDPRGRGRPETAAEFDALLDELDRIMARAASEPTPKARMLLTKTLLESLRDNGYLQELMRGGKRKPDGMNMDWLRGEVLRRREEKFGPRADRLPPRPMSEYHWEPFKSLPRGRDTAGDSMYFLFDGAGLHGVREASPRRIFEIVDAGKPDARLLVRPDPLQKFARLAIDSARPFADFELRARLRPAGPDTVVEIHYRRQGSAAAPDGPALLLSPTGCRLTKLTAGRPGAGLPVPAALRVGVRYDVRLTVYGRVHRLTVDGKTVMDERVNESQDAGALDLIFRGETAVQELRLMVFDNVSRVGAGE